jgi:tetratricopeptide (TPR) repeat protein
MIGQTCLEHPNAQALNRQAITHLRQGDVARALDGFRAATDCRPDFAEAWNNSGMVLHLLGRLSEAIAHFDRALAARPAYPEALTNRGRAYQALGDQGAALADFDRALACAAGRFAASVLHNRGALKQDGGDLAGALADYDRALAIDPEHAATYVNRAAAHKEAGDLPAALADLDHALVCLPHQPAAIYHKRGGVRVLLNDFTGAVADYDRALALEPENFIYYLSRGNARYHLRQARGLADYRMAFRIHPEATAREIVRMLAEDVRQDAEQVLENCARHLRISEHDLLAHVRRGLTLVLLGREDEAVPDFTYARDHVSDMTDHLVQLIRLAQEARIDLALGG